MMSQQAKDACTEIVSDLLCGGYEVIVEETGEVLDSVAEIVDLLDDETYAALDVRRNDGRALLVKDLRELI